MLLHREASSTTLCKMVVLSLEFSISLSYYTFSTALITTWHAQVHVCSFICFLSPPLEYKHQEGRDLGLSCSQLHPSCLEQHLAHGRTQKYLLNRSMNVLKISPQ